MQKKLINAYFLKMDSTTKGFYSYICITKQREDVAELSYNALVAFIGHN
jgi:hypothetical protein